MDAPLIRVEAGTKSYRLGRAAVPALRGVSLAVARGECLSIMGASGSGKSTLLHLLGGLDTADGGSVEVAGQDLAKLDDDARTLFRRRKIGFVFQFFNLMPTLTAEENVALPLLLDGKSRRHAAPRAIELLTRVGLADRRDHRPDELSGGEMQRVAIARALVAEPELLLADEPTGNLDSRTGAEILELLVETAAAERRTIVMVTHDPRAALRGDRVVVLKDGRVDEASAREVRG